MVFRALLLAIETPSLSLIFGACFGGNSVRICCFRPRITPKPTTRLRLRTGLWVPYFLRYSSPTHESGRTYFRMSSLLIIGHITRPLDERLLRYATVSDRRHRWISRLHRGRKESMWMPRPELTGFGVYMLGHESSCSAEPSNMKCSTTKADATSFFSLATWFGFIYVKSSS